MTSDCIAMLYICLGACAPAGFLWAVGDIKIQRTGVAGAPGHVQWQKRGS